MKKINWPLIIGGFIIGLIILVALFPGAFTHINPYGVKNVDLVKASNGSLQVDGAPFPPSKQYLLGSDMLGRDVYSLIIYGTRLTMILGLFIVLGRFLLAIPLGMAAGFGNRICKTIISQFSIIFSAFPALIICVSILSMNFFTSLYTKESVIAFVIVLTLVGWGKLAQMISERVEGILLRPFIKGEIAIGKGNFRIAFENVVPHLLPELIIIFFMEFAIALSIIMQLGVFYVFVGNIRILEDMGGPPILPISFEPEWASMLGAAHSNLTSSPWTFLSPAFAFFVSIFGFNIFGEGLRKVLQRRDSLFIPKVRRYLTIEKRDFKVANLNPIKGKFRVITIILVGVFICFIIGGISDSQFKYDSKNIAFSKNYSEIIIGTKAAEEMANNISKELKVDGFKPITGNSYIVPYSIKRERYCYSGEATLEVNGSKLDFVLGKDFAPGSFENYNIKGQVVDSTGEDLFSLKDYSMFNNKIVLINGNIYSEEALGYFSDKIMKNSSAKGIILLMKKGNNLPGLIGDKVLNFPILWANDTMSDKLIASRNNEITISYKCRSLETTGRNIIGIIPGKDSKLRDEAIMLGFDYNFINSKNGIGMDKIKFEFEMLKKLSQSKRDRSIIVAFWDGTVTDECNGAVYYSKNLIYEPSKISSYIDLTKLNGVELNKVYFNSDLSPISRYFAWVFAHDLKSELSKSIDVENFKGIQEVNEILSSTPNENEAMYMNGSMPVIVVATDDSCNGKKLSLDDIGRIIFRTIQQNKY